jgi:DNA-binding response OmpR family regulator
MGETTRSDALLIVEDDIDLSEMLSAFFSQQGFRVQVANWGEDALRMCVERLPDLVILDIRLPDIDGFEVASRLRAGRRTRYLPIVFLTEKREREDRLRGLSLSASDYVTKPFDLQELRLRVKNTLDHSRRATLTNPVTGLAEGRLVEEALESYAQSPSGGLLRVEIENLDAFREQYGFVASDDLLRGVAYMLDDILQNLGMPEDFLGQIGAGRFVIITRLEQRAPLRDRILKRLAQSFDYFYRNQDLGQASPGLKLQVADWSTLDISGKSLAQIKQELGLASV